MSFIQEVLTYGTELAQNALDAVNGYSIEIQEAYLLFLISNEEANKGMTKQFFEENPKLKGIPTIQSVVEFICEDNFKKDVLCDNSNIHIWTKLSEVKQGLMDYYIHNVCVSKEGSKFYEFHSKFLQMSLQLKRIRLVIQPEFHVIKNVHPVSKIPYLSVRGFWLDDNDKKVKIFTKSMGREDSYLEGKNDEEMLKEASIQIQQLAFQKYQEVYK